MLEPQSPIRRESGDHTELPLTRTRFVSIALQRRLYGLVPLLLMIAVIIFVVLDNN